MEKYRQVAGLLGAYIRANVPATKQIQGFFGDLLVDDELLPRCLTFSTPPNS